MFKTNLKLAFRNMTKNWSSTLLNVLGLTLGIIGSIIVFVTVRYEFSFDQHHENTAEIYRVTNDYYYPTFTMHVGATPDPMAKALSTDFPEFTRAFHIMPNNNAQLRVDQQEFTSQMVYCDENFVEAFDYYSQPAHWIAGDPIDALKEVNKTVLTQSLAEKMFQSAERAMGKIITLRSQLQVEVAAVIKDIPANTNFPFDQLVSLGTIREYIGESFGGVGGTITFVQIPASVSVEGLRPALDAFNEKYMESAWKEDFVSMDLQPLSEVHFDERFGAYEYSYRSSRSFLWTLALIGLFMILIACINFVNLATARAINRSKEMGMRKLLGSSRKHIVGQFMSEAFLLASVSVLLGVSFANIG